MEQVKSATGFFRTKGGIRDFCLFAQNNIFNGWLFHHFKYTSHGLVQAKYSFRNLLGSVAILQSTVLFIKSLVFFLIFQ